MLDEKVAKILHLVYVFHIQMFTFTATPPLNYPLSSIRYTDAAGEGDIY